MAFRHALVRCVYGNIILLRAGLKRHFGSLAGIFILIFTVSLALFEHSDDFVEAVENNPVLEG